MPRYLPGTFGKKVTSMTCKDAINLYKYIHIVKKFNDRSGTSRQQDTGHFTDKCQQETFESATFGSELSAATIIAQFLK